MGLLAPQHTSTPSAPPAGTRRIYAKSTGWYEMDPAGVERLLGPAIEAYTFSVTGAVAVAAGMSRIYLEGNYVIDTVRAAVNTAPTGAALIVDVNKNGATIYTNQANRPSIAAGANSATGNAAAGTAYGAGDYLSVDVDQVGSTVAGADLTVTVRLRRTS